MEFRDSTLNTYLEKNCDPESDLLVRIDRETHLTQIQAHMISGHYQGRLLSMLSKMLMPKRILEIGTYTGYSALCLAEGLAADGELHTIDQNEELEERVQGYFNESDRKHQIHYHIGDASAIIPQIPGNFDLVFIDADKKNNIHYFEMMMERTQTGAVILIDNVLWKGRVLEEQVDKQTAQVVELNQALAADIRVEKLILPIRDGLYILRKK